MMRVAIVGSRNVGNMTLEKLKQHVPKECTQIISGGARGIDTLAEKYARLHGIKFTKILPDYETFGRQAPLVRNGQIVKRADKVLAFWDFKSRGTAHAISECIRLDILIQIIAIHDE